MVHGLGRVGVRNDGRVSNLCHRGNEKGGGSRVTDASLHGNSKGDNRDEL